MDECPNTASIFARTACILSYGGSVWDCWINYFLLLTSVTSWIYYINHQRNARYRPLAEVTPPLPRPTAISFLFLVIFQITLCLLLQCSGISIVWCGIAGWMLTELYHGSGRNRNLLWPPLLCQAVGILYYAMVAPAITTVAHVCAILLGALLYYCSSWVRPEAPPPVAAA